MNLQNRIQHLFEGLVSEGKERGLQAVVYHKGKLVADAWAGTTDRSGNCAVDGETLFPVFSVSKGIASTIVHRLAERGLLNYGARVAGYWPEFGRNGKNSITVSHVLSHTAGIPQVPAQLRMADFSDREAISAAIAGLSPLWPPGSRVEYHAVTFGFIIDEILHRISGKSFPCLLEEEIKKPLGIRDLYIGLPAGLAPTIATLEEVGPEEVFPPNDEPSSVPWWMQPLYAMMNRPEIQRSCNPATTGLMSARSIARHYAALRAGGVDGTELIPPARRREATAPRVLADGTVSPFALGYALGGEKPIFGNRNTVFGHGGHGGSQGFYDVDLDFALGFTRNRIRDPSDTNTGLLVADLVRTSLSA